MCRLGFKKNSFPGNWVSLSWSCPSFAEALPLNTVYSSLLRDS